MVCGINNEDEYVPMHMMLNAKPFWTLLLTNWSGKLSNPTCPANFSERVNASIYQKKHNIIIYECRT